jgi:FkbM family methyltransferase
MGFEPYPDNVEVCRLNYQNLPGSEVFPWAIGERTTVGSFELTGSDPRGGSLNQTPNSGPDGTTKQRIDVEVFSIQDLIETKKLPLPDFVKIDVEGAEMEVLRGIGTAGASIRRMYIETHGEKLMVECMKWVLDHGFTIPHVHSAGPGYAGIWCDRVQAGPA